MSRSLSSLRRGLLGAAVAASLGFGATQAVASPELSRGYSCLISEGWYVPDHLCYDECGATGGYCDGFSRYCTCW